MDNDSIPEFVFKYKGHIQFDASFYIDGQLFSLDDSIKVLLKKPKSSFAEDDELYYTDIPIDSISIINYSYFENHNLSNRTFPKQEGSYIGVLQVKD